MSDNQELEQLFDMINFAKTLEEQSVITEDF